MENLRASVEAMAFPVGLAVVGGVARGLRAGIKSWKLFLGSLFVSGFTGALVHLFLQDVHLSESLRAAVTGLSGYAGGSLLDVMTMRLQHSVEHWRAWDGVERRGREHQQKTTGAEDAGEMTQSRRAAETAPGRRSRGENFEK